MANEKWRKFARNRFVVLRKKGGAGVVNLAIKNKALLAKWRWRLAVEKKSL